MASLEGQGWGDILKICSSLHANHMLMGSDELLAPCCHRHSLHWQQFQAGTEMDAFCRIVTKCILLGDGSEVHCESKFS